MAADISVAECNERLAGCSQLAELLGSSETELFKEVIIVCSAPGQNPLETLFWRVNNTEDIQRSSGGGGAGSDGRIYCNLTGQLILVKEAESLDGADEEEMWTISRLLDQEAGQKLVEVFSLGEPFNIQLVESLNRQARAYLDASLLGPTEVKLPVQFRSSVLLNKQEYRVYLLSSPACGSLAVPPLKTLEALHAFYAEHGDIDPERLESLVFDGDGDGDTEALQSCCQCNEPFTCCWQDPPLPEAERFFTELRSARAPHQKLRLLRQLVSDCCPAGEGADALLPRLTEFVQGSALAAGLPSELAFVRGCLEGRLVDGEVNFVLTTLEAAVEHLRATAESDVLLGQAKKAKAAAEAEAGNNIAPTSSSLTTPIASLLFSSISAVTGRLQRLSRAPSQSAANDELAAFRERMMACNSAADLLVRDLNPLLEDYKNILYVLTREGEKGEKE